MTPEFDYALIGGGLGNGLLTLAIRAAQPEARIVLVERDATVGGNHTWCFHSGDVAADWRPWIDPIVATRWPGYDVMFTEHQRRLDTEYAQVSSQSLAAGVLAALDRPGSKLCAGSTATDSTATSVTVRGGDGKEHVLHAIAVIDARGPGQLPAAECGWQKFLGQELVLEAPHGLDRPILMDARVEQTDGFRFFYVLPLAEDRLLVEDTYFSDSPDVNEDRLRDAIGAYCQERGWAIAECVREERGLLPMPFAPMAPVASAPLIAGYAGGWFHPVTAYSFPIAARLAAFVAARPAADLFGPELELFVKRHSRQLAFASRLSRMLFRWYPPEKRHHVLAHFYRRSVSLIERFYALDLTAMDRARIFAGRPPRGLSMRAVWGGAR